MPNERGLQVAVANHAEQSAFVAKLLSDRQVPSGVERKERQRVLEEIVQTSNRDKDAKQELSPVSDEVLNQTYYC